MRHVKYFLTGLGIMILITIPFLIGWGVALLAGVSNDDGAPLFGTFSYIVLGFLFMAYGIGRDFVFREDQ